MLFTEYDEMETMQMFKEEGREEGLEQGRIIGTVDTMRDDGRSDAEIIDRIISKYNLSRSTAEQYVCQTVTC